MHNAREWGHQGESMNIIERRQRLARNRGILAIVMITTFLVVAGVVVCGGLIWMLHARQGAAEYEDYRQETMLQLYIEYEANIRYTRGPEDMRRICDESLQEFGCSPDRLLGRLDRERVERARHILSRGLK